MEPAEAKFFESSQEAVEIISRLLRKKDWAALTCYYYLEQSNVDAEDLLCGEFFVFADRPAPSHPGIGVYKHPFNPAFDYDYHRDGPNDTIYVVLSIEIEQGDGMLQRGYDFFKMKKSPKGLQVLPDKVDYDEAFGIPPGIDDLLSNKI